MKQDFPTLSDILRTVREYLEGIQSVVPEHERYHALCSIYLLSIAEREVTASTASVAEEVRAIGELLGDAVAIQTAVPALAKAIREGRLDSKWDMAFDLVMRQVIDKVSITKPEHLAPQHRSASSGLHQG